MRYYGDIPKNHLELVKELQTLEEWFYEHGDVPALSGAKGMVCIAHDYHFMEMEEEGNRLLRVAHRLCPGYFKGPIYAHMAKDDQFDRLVHQLKQTLALDLMYQLGFGE